MRPARVQEIICFSSDGMDWRWHSLGDRKNGGTVTFKPSFLGCHYRVHTGVPVGVTDPLIQQRFMFVCGNKTDERKNQA